MAKYTARELKEHDIFSRIPGPKKKRAYWFPARPLNYQFDSLWMRLKLAWGVLRGKYDALDWQGH